MSKKVLYLLGIALTILLGTWLQYSFCCTISSENEIQITESDSSEVSIESKPIKNVSPDYGFHFKTESDYFKTTNNFTFLNSDFNLLLPVSDSINIGIEKLKNSLINSTSKFSLNGYYSSTEENNSIFPDLGIARATAVKNYLISKGIPENKLTVSSSLTSILKQKGDTLLQSISFNWNSINNPNINSNINWSTIKTEINANPIRLYFETGQSSIVLNDSDKEKLNKIIDYINNVEGSKILITGHTDNTTGPNNTNEYYSLKRAEFAKSYLVTNGILPIKIVTQGKAATMPIADNNTEDGRAKNRRAEISIQ